MTDLGRNANRNGPEAVLQLLATPEGIADVEWVDWFNNRRLLEPIGNIPPAEAEANYYAMLEQPDMAA